MTTLTVQNRETLKTTKLVVDMNSSRSAVIAYVNRVYPQYHIVSFEA